MLVIFVLCSHSLAAVDDLFTLLLSLSIIFLLFFLFLSFLSSR